MDPAAYLRRIGIDDDPGAPSARALKALQRAHVERVPYETIEIQLERQTTVDPSEAAARIVGHRRGGYCYHLNGAFSLLLRALGYDVTWHRGGVQTHFESRSPGATGSHLALTVANLPSEDNPDDAWLVDAGLGDALHEPLPLLAGTYRQGPFVYALAPSEAEPGGWRFEHDPRMSFVAMDFRPGPATQDDFRDRHAHLSTSPESKFVRVFSAQRRDATGVDVLTGCVLERLPDDDPPTTLDTRDEWAAALHDVFGLDLPEIDRDRLWTRVRGAHERWLAQYER